MRLYKNALGYATKDGKYQVLTRYIFSVSGKKTLYVVYRGDVVMWTAKTLKEAQKIIDELEAQEVEA